MYVRPTLNLYPRQSSGLSGGSASGAGTTAGAAIGSVIPGIGTAVGAIVGSIFGGLFKKNRPAIDDIKDALNTGQFSLITAQSWAEANLPPDGGQFLKDWLVANHMTTNPLTGEPVDPLTGGPVQHQIIPGLNMAAMGLDIPAIGGMSPLTLGLLALAALFIIKRR